MDERLSAYQNLSIYASLYKVPKTKIRERVMELLELFELADRAREKVGAYSKGMKQRLALARALLHDPEILFLDEPTAGLDPVASRQVHDLILHLSQDENRTVFLCTHNLTEAQRLCHRIGVMEQGELVAIGATHELAQSAGLRIRLEIEVAAADSSKAVAHLQTRFPELQVTPENHHLAITGASHLTIPKIIEALVQEGIAIFQVTPHEASLEDIYFALHQKGHPA
jgi:ABC-2 type transport system ATP-binding protein